MFIVTLFMITNSQKRPKCPSERKWQTVVHLDYGIVFSDKKEMSFLGMEKLKMHIRRERIQY